MSLVLATGNKIKIAEATEIANKFDVEFDAQQIDLVEIQNHDPIKVIKAKVRAAYELIKKPLIVHDSSWEIPEINGFPGVYMYDIAEYFAPNDWLKLMKNRKDRTIKLCQTIAYFDGQDEKIFQSESIGKFVDASRGNSGNSIDKTVSFSTDGRTLAECHDDAGLVVRDKNMQVWTDFFKWYSKAIKEGV